VLPKRVFQKAPITYLWDLPKLLTVGDRCGRDQPSTERWAQRRRPEGRRDRLEGSYPPHMRIPPACGRHSRRSPVLPKEMHGRQHERTAGRR